MKDKHYRWMKKFLESLGIGIIIIALIPIFPILLIGVLFATLSDKMGASRFAGTGLYNRLVPLDQRSEQRWCLQCRKQVPVKYPFCSSVCEKQWKSGHPEAKHEDYWAIPVNTQLWCVS